MRLIPIRLKAIALIDVDEVKNAIVGKEIVDSPGYESGLLPVWLAEEGVPIYWSACTRERKNAK